MTATDSTITLAPPPSTPVVLCNASFLATLAAVEAEVKDYKIGDIETYRHAATLQGRLNTAQKVLETARTQAKAPFLDMGRRIDEAARAPAERIAGAKRDITNVLVAYDNEQRRIAAEAERARLAEVERLRKQAEAEALAARRKAEELAAKAEADRKAKEAADVAAAKAGAVVAEDLDLDDAPEEPAPAGPTETEQKLAAVMHAPAAVAPRVEGVRYKTTLVARVVSVNALPDVFVRKEANQAAINAAFCTSWKEGMELPVCAGIEFTIKRDVVSDGRRAW